MSISDIFGPIDYVSNIKNLVSFKSVISEVYSIESGKQIFPSLMTISKPWNTCLKHHE